jgi:homoserine dehydrogenase
MKEIGVGLVGFGTVGAGVVSGLQRNGDLIAERLGARPVLRKIADLDLDSDRGVTVDASLLTRDASEIIADPEIQVVVELIGGTGAAKSVVEQALAKGKSVVTANKALLADHGEEIFALARANGAGIYFGASVGGGIPVIRALREGLIANRIETVYGILNGTCNYILKRMEEAGLSFDDALAEAQEAGFAEADPTLDVDGYDTAHKAAIIARLAHGLNVPSEGVCIEGIRGLADEDIEYAHDLGYKIKLLAIIKRDGQDVELRIHPTLVPVAHMLASVNGVFNAVMISGDMVGETLYYGRGAGREPTASTVLADVSDAVLDFASGARGGRPVSGSGSNGVRLKPMGDVETRYYFRLSVLDKPGTFAEIASVLGAHDISIASVLQKEERINEHVPVVIVTPCAKESRVVEALEKIDAMGVVGAATIALRIED